MTLFPIFGIRMWFTTQLSNQNTLELFSDLLRLIIMSFHYKIEKKLQSNSNFSEVFDISHFDLGLAIYFNYLIWKSAAHKTKVCIS